MKYLKHIVYAAIIVALLAGLVLYADPGKVAAALMNANPAYVLLGFAAGTISILVRVKKWAVLIERPFTEIISVQLAGLMISNFTPGKVAEPIKAVFLKKKSGIDVSASMPSMIWERVMDVIIMLILTAFVIFTMPLGGNLKILSAIGVGIFIILITVVILVMHVRRAGGIIFRISRKIPLLNRILTEGFVENFYSVRIRKIAIAKCFFWTLLAWLLDGIAFYLAFMALGIEPPFILILAGIISLSVIIAIASTLPGGIGSFEIIATVLLGILGIDSGTAVPLVFLYRIVTFWFSVFVGVAALAYLGKKIDIFGAMKEKKIYSEPNK